MTMAERNIPIRPYGYDSKALKDGEKDCITWYVLSGCRREYAFARFVRPDLTLTEATLKAATKQFFSNADVIKYMEAYKKTLQEFGNSSLNTSEDYTDEERDKKKIKALKRLVDYVINQAQNIENLDDPTTLLKIADKVGFFDDGADKIEKPRRYLPVRCVECTYHSFVENCVKNGDVRNDCDYCRAKDYAVANGFRFDPKRLLKTPEEMTEKGEQ